MARSSTKTPATPVLPEGMKRFLMNRLAESGGLVLIALGAGLLVAASGYDATDPSFNSSGAGAVQNPLGLIGSYTADLALQTLGLAGLLPALVFAAWGARLILKKDISWAWIRVALLAVAMPLGAVALAALPKPAAWPLDAALGGVIGSVALGSIATFAATLTPVIKAWMIAALAGTLGASATLVALGFSPAEWKALGHAILRWMGRTLRGVQHSAIRALIATQKLAGLKDRVAAVGSNISEKMPDVADLKKPGLTKLTMPKLTMPNIGRATALMPDERIEPVLGGDGPAYVSGQESTHAGRDIETETPAAPGAPISEARTGLVEPKKSRAKPSKKALAQRQKSLNLGGNGEYVLPPLDLLEAADANAGDTGMSKDALEQNAKMLSSVLADFGVKGEIVKVRPGPVVTLYELAPAPGTKTSRVIGLSDDIARSMSAVSVRVAVVPGQNVIGIELPNVHREMVVLRELLESNDFDKAGGKSGGKLNLALGKDIGGQPMIVDLARMPHLLISGTTGSGKSVGINTMILSLLYQMTPDECRFIMIDPKMLELSVYEGIPHLLTPVVTDPGKAVVALKWTVREMEDRYKLMAQMGVRNIAGYNKRLAEARKKGEVMTRKVQTGFDDAGKPVYEDQPLSMDPLPFIVVVVDEMADLMLVAGKDIEGAVQRLAQMARAAGIHLIMATQRPSVDVITGTIKANFPTRVAFQVTSRIDSRTILGEPGAEHLLGQGDMLYMAGGGRITRVHGPFCSDEEVEEIVNHLKGQGQPAYIQSVTEEPEEIALPGGGGSGGDDLYDQAVALVAREGKASTSFIQRHLQIGYNRAARIIEQMEKDQVVSSANRVGRREVLIGAGRELAS